MNATPPINYAAPGELPPHLMPKALEREREREQREKERKSSIPGSYNSLFFKEFFLNIQQLLDSLPFPNIPLN